MLPQMSFETNFSMIDQENLCRISVIDLTISLPYYYVLLPYYYCSDTICDLWWHLKTPLAYVNNLIPVHLVMDRRSCCPLGWRLLVMRWDKLQLTQSFSKYGLILVHGIERIYTVLQVTWRGSPSDTVEWASPVQGCLVIQLLSSVCVNKRTIWSNKWYDAHSKPSLPLPT